MSVKTLLWSGGRSRIDRLKLSFPPFIQLFMQSFIAFSFLFLSSLVYAESRTLICYDELGRKSTILTVELSTGRARVEESGDEFLCAPGMDVYCTTSVGEAEESSGLLTISWLRELSGERSVFEIDTSDLSYIGEYAGGIWQGHCEQADIN